MKNPNSSFALFAIALVCSGFGLSAAQACDQSRGEICQQCSGNVCVGDQVYDVGRNSDLATVVGIQSDGSFVLRFSDGVGGNWDRSDLAVTKGCAGDICVGQSVYDVGRNSDQARVVGIETNGEFVLQFDDGTGGNWSRSDLAVETGCSQHVCVGDRVYDVGRNSDLATVVGIENNGEFVLQFADAAGGNWDRSDLAITHGCANGICVGQQVYDVARNSDSATVVGIETNGEYVLQFDDGTGGNWSRSDLVCKND